MAARRPRKRRRSEASATANKRGLPPGTAVYTGKERTVRVSMHIVRYDPHQATEQGIAALSEAFPLSAQQVSWINVDGLHDVPTIEALAIEDALDVSTPPKADDFGSHVYLALKMATLRDGDRDPRHLSRPAGGRRWICIWRSADTG